jgi:hypothetical protein
MLDVVATPQSAPDAPLPATATGALRCWLDAHRREPASQVEVHRAMRLVADAAHRGGVRIEQVILTLKDAWATLSAAGPVGAGRELLDSVITACIQEYYDRPAPDGSAAAPSS